MMSTKKRNCGMHRLMKRSPARLLVTSCDLSQSCKPMQYFGNRIIYAFRDGDFLYIHKTRNSSVDIFCESAKQEENLFAFSLTRKLLQSRSVLYLHKGSKPSINKSEDKNRITAQDKMDNHTVHLIISNLQGQDTDVYNCQFHYAHEPCNCSSYLPLLYVISAAVCLLGVMVVTFATIYCCKRPKRKPPQPMVPVYEEMTGVQPAKEKATKLQETNNFLLSKENYYEKPKSRQFIE